MESENNNSNILETLKDPYDFNLEEEIILEEKKDKFKESSSA